LFQGGGGSAAVAKAFAAVQAAGDYGSPARARRHRACHHPQSIALEEQVLTGLSAEELFEQVIRRDNTFGSLLQEIKVAYESFLGEHGVAIPSDPIAIAGPSTSVAARTQPQPDAVPPTPPDVRSNHAELAVDAARRRLWKEMQEDMTARNGDEVEECDALERENAALRKLVKRLRVDLVAESEMLEGEAIVKEAKPRRRPDASWGPPPRKDAVSAGGSKVPKALGLTALPATTTGIPAATASASMPTLAIDIEYASARSEGSSTVSGGGSCEVLNTTPWCLPEARKRMVASDSDQMIRPSGIPALDLSRISWLIDEESQEGTVTESYDDSQDAAGEALDSTLIPQGVQLQASESIYAGGDI